MGSRKLVWPTIIELFNVLVGFQTLDASYWGHQKLPHHLGVLDTFVASPLCFLFNWDEDQCAWHSLIPLFMVNIGGHTMTKETNTENIRIVLWMHTIFLLTLYNIRGLHCRLQYFFDWKIMCIWEASNKVRSNSYPSYLGGFEYNIWVFDVQNRHLQLI